MIHLTPTESSWYPGERLSKKRSPKPIWFGIIPFAATLIAAILFLFVFRVRVVLTSRPLRKDITKTIIGKNIFLLDEKEISKFISRTDPTVRKVTLQRSIPQTVILTVFEDTPVAQVLNGTTSILVDSSGKIIRTISGKDDELPKIAYYQHLRAFESKPGTDLSQPEIVKALEIIALRKQLPAKLKLVSVPEQNRIVLTFVDLPLTVRLNTKKDIAKNLFILHNIIKGLDKKGVRPSVINLEFDKPVITV